MTGLVGGALTDLLDGLARQVWTGALALLRAVLGLVGTSGRVDPSPGAGPISATLWSSMLQLALIVAVVLFFAQLAMAVLNPRRHLLHAVTGLGQYGVATAISVGLVAALLGAADGLTTLILQQGADVTNAAAAMDRLGLTDDNNAVKAVVLAILAVIGVLPLAVGYGIMLLFRSASILVLIATLPVVTAGLVNLATRHWFWRAVRWLLALIFLQPTFALCFTIGTDIVATGGAAAGPTPPAAGAAPAAAANGTGLVTLLLGLAILFVALFAPFALFRLLAFVEPGTMPHQTMMSAFGSAVAGFKQSGAAMATADIGSVFSSATGGRFGAGGSGAGSGSGDEKKKAAATAALAAATGGGSLAAGAGAGAGEAGAADGAASGTSGPSAATSANAAGALSGTGHSGSGSSEAGQDSGQGEIGGAGGGAAAPIAAPAAADGRGAVGGRGAGTGGGSVGAGSSGSTSGGAAGGTGGGSLAGYWQSARASAGGGGGALGAAGSAVGSVAGGAWGAGAAIAGYTPMPPAPHGGAGGRVNDPAPTDFGGARPSGGPAANAYRDPSFDRPYAGFDSPAPHRDDDPGGGGPYDPDDGDDDRDDEDRYDDDRYDDTGGAGRLTGVL